jgi:hypothetical protein
VDVQRRQHHRGYQSQPDVDKSAIHASWKLLRDREQYGRLCHEYYRHADHKRGAHESDRHA